MEEEEVACLDTIFEVRQEHMVSPSPGANPTRRIAHFLKPTLHAVKDPPPHDFLLPHSLLSAATSSNPEKNVLEVRYNGWLGPYEEWKTWVELLQPKYETLWIKAGIYQAINASLYQIHRNDKLLFGLARRWYCKTNSFIFPWGEATITLEDMKVCGGYSVLGDPVFSPLETQEQKETEAKLVAARRIFNSTKARKVVHKPWMMHFMKNDRQVEHEAFLTLWLSRFVFPANSRNTILKSVFPIAIHLARGTRMALAPAVLASIYRDLSLLKNSINKSTVNKNDPVTLWAPFQLVQIWALERFPALQPQPNVVEQGHPIMARWHSVKMLNNNNLMLALDSAGARNCFMWHPYKNFPSLQLCNEKDMWVCDNPYLEDELQSFGRCLRVCELVGIGCTEQYLPHRVAMQFGMDQDIPDMVARCNRDSLISWRNYSRPMIDRELCFALCAFQFEPNVTSRYNNWWKLSKLGKVEYPTRDSDHCVVSQASCGVVEGEGSHVPPPGFPSKRKRDEVRDSDQEDVLTTAELLSCPSKVRSIAGELVGNCKALSSPQSGVLPSSSVIGETAESMTTGGVYNFTESKDLLRGSKGTMEDVVEGARRAKKDANEAKMKSFCDTYGVNDKKGKCASPCTVDAATQLENRIWELEKIAAKLKAAKFVPKLKNIGAKANLSVP